MELSYWESRWRKNNIGFHMPDGYEGLRRFWNNLNLPENPEVLVPLCGKAIDMIWMEKQGASITGAEISGKAVREFMDENRRTYETDSFADFTIYRSDSVSVWCGDFLKLPKHKLPEFDLIYDKAALVALPQRMRSNYCKKLISLCSAKTKILLHHFIYDQNEMPGPPFSVSFNEIESGLKNHFEFSVLEKNELNLSNFEKFQRRGLKSRLTEQLLFLTPDSEK